MGFIENRKLFGRFSGWWARALVPLLLAAAVMVWFGPALVGWMPAGGDASAFFYPLMSWYGESIARGDWPPLWNDRWGYGFPALAESQIGAFYPPHLVLLWLFSPEQAYALNLPIHMLLLAGFSYLAARTMGVGRWGAGLTGLVFFAGGFFTIHTPHQWAYTAGCWFPLVILLSWRVLELPVGECASARAGQSASQQVRSQSGEPKAESRLSPFAFRFSLTRPFAVLLLSAVLAIQMLAGHFQLAFYTQVTMLLLALGNLFVSGRRLRTRWIGSGLVVLVWLASGAMCAVQLLPTGELARYAHPQGQSYEHLSGFAYPPFHLVGYLAGLWGHRHPLWRGVLWSPPTSDQPDLWHTSPEECLGYVGLLPLCLALGGLWRWRQEPVVRLWGVVVIVSGLLSFGPYLPGFRWLIELPGFGSFRSPARWSMVTQFGLALLAGWAFDRLSSEELRHWVRRFAVVWVAVMLIVVGGIWWLVHREPGSQAFPLSLGRAFWQWTNPWKHAGGLDELLRQARTPRLDEQTAAGLAGLSYDLSRLAPGDLTLLAELAPRPSGILGLALPPILIQEVLPVCVVMLALVLLTFRWWPGRWFWILAVGLTVADLGMLTRVRSIQWERQSWPEDSRVLRALAEVREAGVSEPSSPVRTVDPLRNLPLAVGAAPLLSYRTLDVPAFDDLLPRLAEVGQRRQPEVEKLLRLSGVEVSVRQGPMPQRPGAAVRVEQRRDPVLDRVFLGPEYARQVGKLRPELLEYHLVHWPTESGSAWVLPRSLGADGWAPGLPLPAPDEVRAATVERPSSRTVLLRAEATEPSLLVLADLYYPGWGAELYEAGAEDDPGRRVAIRPAWGAWRSIELPEPGQYAIRMSYRPQSFRWGAMLSALAWVIWLAAVLITVTLWHRAWKKRVQRCPGGSSNSK